MASGGDLDSNRIITMDGMEFLMNWEEGGGEGEAEGASNDAQGAAAARPLQPSGEAATTAAAVGGGQPQHRKANSGSWQFDPVLLPPPGVAPTAEDPRQPAASVSVGPGLGATSHASSATASSGTAAADVAAAAYFLAQGAPHLHPLAMTSLASCPPHATTNFVTLPQPSSGQAGRQDGQMPPPAQPAPTGGTVFNFPSIVTNANNANPGVLPGGADQNAAFAAHLSELAANFQSSNAAAATSLHGHVPAPLHFGMTVNGFHPQVNAQVNPLQMPTSLHGVGGVSGSLLGVGAGMAAAPAKPPAGTGTGAPPRQNSLTKAANQASATNAVSIATSTAMSTHQRNARDRNEREQVRAKKITELITELRVNMQQGGWKEEMKSKYQTLSQCREYMVHLQRSHAAKEQDIAKTKRLVAEKAAMLEAQAKSDEADGASDVQCSDHDQTESVTSSLTDSTVRSTSSDANGMDCSSTSSGDRSEDGSNKSRKRQSGDIAREEAAPAAEVPANKKGCRKSSRHRRTERKKKPVAGESPAETSSTSEEDGGDGGNGFPGGKNIQFDKTSSSVSDMTDSNRGSAARRGGAGDGSTSSISSTAAVVRGLGSSRDSGPSSRHRKRRRSLPAVEEEKANPTAGAACAAAVAAKPVTRKKKRRSSSHYNYREVFLKSNVPQLIATLSGRIVVWNEFFLTATGLSERDAKRLTIFSIVESDQLSSLYKMVARALAEKGGVSSGGSDPTGSTSGPATSATESSATKSECTDNEEWQAITLKCTSFPSHAKDGDKKATHHPNPLYITVALMEDENRDQRCFHCILTDRPGTEPGKLGSVTPELFALLFAPKAKKKETACS